MEEESNENNEVGIQESHKDSNDNDDNNIANLKEDLTIIKEELLAARKSSDNNLNKLKYMMAEFDNYRKQMEKQIDSRIESGKGELLLKFLGLRDDYLRALEMAKQSKSEAVVIEGLEGILKNFDSLLKSEGVMEIETIGTPFDPNVHDVIGFSHEEEIEENIITKEIRKGYMLNNKVLRPSLVLISRKIVTNTATDTQKIEKEAEN
ncbi:MAG TPA: nucleotide exchange factor GrpE [Nitrososphaeraceae archaeon]|nr:nucleotide exchange factor GrpE [Nitrososphaeraceae archaeon]